MTSAQSRLLTGVLLLAAVACSNGTTTRATPSPATSSPATDPRLVIAVTSRSGALELYRVGTDRRATRVAVLAPPATSTHPVSVTLDTHAQVCAVWLVRGADEETGPHTLLCYAPGVAHGAEVAGVTGRPLAVALRPDGRALAWLDSHGTPSYQIDAVAGDLGESGVSAVRRVVPDPARPPGKEGCCMILSGPAYVAWSGGDTLALSINGQDDEGGGLVLQSLQPATVARGWLNGATPVAVPQADVGYRYFDAVTAADARKALAIERDANFFQENDARPSRAVRVDLTTGHVVEVVSTPLPGRMVTGVNGGARGIVYRTERISGGDVRYYLRLPGEPHGVALTGLPDDVDEVYAEP